MAEVGYTLVALIAVAVVGGLVTFPALRRRRSIEPAISSIDSPLSSADVFLAFFLWFFWQWFVFAVLHRSPGLNWVYGTEPDKTSLGLWVATVSTPFVVISLLLALSGLRRIRPAEWIGLPGRRWADVLVGYITWLGWTPPLLIMYFAISLVIPIEEHPFEKVGRAGVHPVDWVLFFLSAMIMAPVVEELLFRGVVLRWLLGIRAPAHLGIALAAFLIAALPLLEPEPQLTELEKALLVESGEEPPSRWAGPLLVLALCPAYGYVVWRSLRLTQAREFRLAAGFNLIASVYGSALLFAAMHSRVWPSPIPLFFLGIGLAWAALRTGGLLAPVFAHALFNGVACIEVLLDWLKPF